MAVKGREFRFAVGLERDGRFSAEGRDPLEPEESWTPEHLVLAALVRCSLASLRFHAERTGADVVGSGSASGLVTRRESDGRYAFVEVECRLDVEVDPPPPSEEELQALVGLAERDCFVGASLTVKPRYEWVVNSARVEPS